MATEIYNDPQTDFSPILDTATVADRPMSALLAEKIRDMGELLIVQVHGLFGTGTLTSDPPNDTTGYAIDTAAGFSVDEHNLRRIMFASGNAKGQDFLIDDTDAGNNRVVCTGDNLYAAGARSGDDYVIVGDFRDSAGGHAHDGADSRPVESPVGRTVAFSCTECSAGSSGYSTAFRCYFYIPTNPTTLIAAAVGWVVSNTATVRIEITDSNSAEFNTNEDTFTSTTVPTGEMIGPLSVDLSDAAAGWAHADIEIKNSGSANSFIYGLQAFWNT